MDGVEWVGWCGGGGEGWGGVQKVGEVEGAYVRVVIGSMIRGVRERIKIINGGSGPTYSVTEGKRT